MNKFYLMMTLMSSVTWAGPIYNQATALDDHTVDYAEALPLVAQFEAALTAGFQSATAGTNPWAFYKNSAMSSALNLTNAVAFLTVAPFEFYAKSPRFCEFNNKQVKFKFEPIHNPRGVREALQPMISYKHVILNRTELRSVWGTTAAKLAKMDKVLNAIEGTPDSPYFVPLRFGAPAEVDHIARKQMSKYIPYRIRRLAREELKVGGTGMIPSSCTW